MKLKNPKDDDLEENLGDFAFGDDFFGYTTKGTSHEKHKGKPKELGEYNLFILGFRHPPPVNQLEIHSLWTKTPRWEEQDN